VFYLLILLSTASAEELKPATREAFDRYVQISEQVIAKDEAPGGTFLLVDGLPENDRSAAMAKLRGGDVYVQRRATLDQGKPFHTSGGLIHHWAGSVFVPNANIPKALKMLQDYDRHSDIYAPEVQRSKTIEHNGNDFRIYYRLKRKKVITVVMDAYYDVHYGPVSNGRSTSRSYSTKIQEIEHPGQSDEKAQPPDDGNGFMWRLDTYWHLLERDGGLYIQCEAISLSRDIPTGLAWMIGSYVESIPRESLVFTLGRTREWLLAH
jgi:hypothetical protein